MRRGFLLATLGLGAIALFALILVSPRSRTTSMAQPSSTASAEGAPEAPTPAPAPAEVHLRGQTELPPARPFAIAHAKAEGSQTEASVVNAQDEEHEARVAARVAALEALSTKTDRASLETLLAEVKNPEREIRQAALDALSQAGHRAAIPALREADAQTTDPTEKQAILDVIEFMSLPTLTEVLSGQGATNSPKPAPARP